MIYDRVIRNAHCVTAADEFIADIGINDGVITALGRQLEKGASETDAAGRWVTPGGVDAHCHFDQPTNDNSRMADDFSTGTRSAACGGTTTVIPFALQQKGQSLHDAIGDYHRRAGEKAVIDYAFHLIVTDPTKEVIQQELPSLISDGYTSFKIYMTYDNLKLTDREIIDSLEAAREYGALVMIHAENADCIAWLTERLLADSHNEPRYHALSRPKLVERDATHRAITFCELVDTPILIVHVSSREALEQIRWARAKGLSVYAETCPQYLLLTEDDLDDDGSYDAIKNICSPPPRSVDDQSCVWKAIVDGTIHIFSSDHAPFRLEGRQGKRATSRAPSFNCVANGIPGVETRLPLLFSYGVMEGCIDIHQFVALTATNPARLYGLSPRKGTIAIGSDADLVVWDVSKTRTISNNELHHNVDYTPFEGMRASAWPAITFSRGSIVCEDNVDLGRNGYGTFIRCGTPGPSKLMQMAGCS